MSSNKEFGEWLKKRREEAGFSATYKFADEIGFDKTYVGRIESGDRPPTATFCIAIAPVLGFTKDYVLNLAGLADDQQNSERDYTDVEETQTILDTFPSPESRRRAVHIANNLLRQLAQNERESARSADRASDVAPGKTARRNATA